VPDLGAVLRLLLSRGCHPFQADFQSNRRTVADPEDSLDFGTGTLFVHDPDRNLIEFLQLGRGLFTKAMSPRGR
jgi:hypothetical protein